MKVPKFVKDVPIGLSELMSDISREVLRAQPSPDNIYEFIGDYLESLIAARERTTVVRYIIDDILDMNCNIAERLNQRGISFEKANEAAIVIQKCFRSYMAKRELRKAELNESNIFKELVDKCNFTYKEILQSGPAIRNAFKHFVQEYTRILKGSLFSDEAFELDIHNAFEIYLNSTSKSETFNDDGTKTEDTFPDRVTQSPSSLSAYNRAACTIQRSFRKYQKRKKLREALKELRKEIKAAIKIQAMFRGYITRKKFSSGELIDMSSSAIEKLTFGESKLAKDEENVNHSTETNQKAQKAAIIIQAYFRGFRVRKAIQKGVPVEDVIQMFGTIQKRGDEKNENLKEMNENEIE